MKYADWQHEVLEEFLAKVKEIGKPSFAWGFGNAFNDIEGSSNQDDKSLVRTFKYEFTVEVPLTEDELANAVLDTEYIILISAEDDPNSFILDLKVYGWTEYQKIRKLFEDTGRTVVLYSTRIVGELG